MDIVISEPGKGSNPLLSRVDLIQGDITAQDVDAIVSLLPKSLDYRGRLNETIMRAAGPELDAHVLEHIYRPQAGDIHVAPGFDLPSGHVIFGITPDWRDDFEREDSHLLNCLRGVLKAAQDLNIDTLAFPPLASGRNGFPLSKAARLMAYALDEYLHDDIEEVRIVCPDKRAFQAYHDRLTKEGWPG